MEALENEMDNLNVEDFEERYNQARTKLLKEDFPDAAHLVDQLGEDVAEKIMSHITKAMHLFGVSKKRLEVGIEGMRAGQHNAIEGIDDSIRHFTSYNDNYEMLADDATYDEHAEGLQNLVNERRFYNQRYAFRVHVARRLSEDYPNNYNFTPASFEQQMNYP